MLLLLRSLGLLWVQPLLVRHSRHPMILPSQRQTKLWKKLGLRR
jgi:hypothetical protein